MQTFTAVCAKQRSPSLAFHCIVVLLFTEHDILDCKGLYIYHAMNVQSLLMSQPLHFLFKCGTGRGLLFHMIEVVDSK